LSTTPPEPPAPPPPPPPPPPSQPSGYSGYGATTGAILPVPGNAELAIWLIVEIVLAIIWAASDGLDAGGWVTATTVLTAAYVLSRGIAKASRVLER
jgi:hypothetical protein